MRKYKFEEYIKNRPKFTRVRLKLKRPQRSFRNYRRKRDEERVLIGLARARWKRWLEKGKIKKTGRKKIHRETRIIRTSSTTCQAENLIMGETAIFFGPPYPHFKSINAEGE